MWRVTWPINLIITDDLIEAYQRVHKFLFPIRQLQIEIEKEWLEMKRFTRDIEINDGLEEQEDKWQLRVFERNMAALRN
jgi:hypothetical protein